MWKSQIKQRVYHHHKARTTEYVLNQLDSFKFVRVICGDLWHLSVVVLKDDKVEQGACGGANIERVDWQKAKKQSLNKTNECLIMQVMGLHIRMLMAIDLANTLEQLWIHLASIWLKGEPSD